MSFPSLRIPWFANIALGSLLVVVPLLWYQIAIGKSSVITDGNIAALERIAYATTTLIFVGLLLAFVSLTRSLQGITSRDNGSDRSSVIRQLSSAISDPRSAKLLAIGSVSYGLLSGIVSGTLAFQPASATYDTYAVHLPSIVPVVCCGDFGQMPQLVVYASQQLAILIVPANMVLLFTASWLVGLNAATANFAYANRPKLPSTNWIAGLGAIIGLFTFCPTCAGLFFLATIGLGGAVGLALTLSSLQTVFIGIGIPILAITPMLTLRGMLAPKACQVAKQN